MCEHKILKVHTKVKTAHGMGGCGSGGRAGCPLIRVDPRLLQSTCRSGLGQATEPQIAPEGIAIGVCVHVNELD